MAAKTKSRSTARSKARQSSRSPKRDRHNLGQSFIFPPKVIDDIHIKAELGRYRMRGFSIFKKIPTWDDLTFLPGTLTRFVIEGYREKCETKTILGPRCKRPLELDIPIYITGMSFGALSHEAKTALARGATMAGTATCSGEGGMIPDERRYSSKWFYQCIQSRYGFNPHHLLLADGCEFFIGQGAKVGLGGHLMGQKVSDQVAEMRSLPAGIDQRSPARHPDWLGPDDLSLKIQEIREATNWEIPIQLKLGAARVYDDVRMAAKTDPDCIYMDGMEGSTGAGPHLATEETGVPGIAAIRQARKALDDVGQSGNISLIYAGGIRNGGDVAKALALGADAVAIGHSSLMALNCNKDIPEADFEKEIGVEAGYCYHCHTGRCP
ncbi:MAG: FMN-binding glutamate synthase family protein, partial [Acidiferrobacterales bacterium]